MAAKKLILVVEDNDLNREMLTLILSEDYEVLQAANGNIALDLLAQYGERVSAILLDIEMPVMDGVTFLRHAREDELLSSIPIIVMTQNNADSYELDALTQGATDFLSKPYRPQVLRQRLAGLIKLRETATMVNQLQYDRLTGLYTKEYFYEKVKQTLRDNPESHYTLIASNIENFKLFNDAMGMAEGDRLLKEAATSCLESVEDFGFAGRFNADRFLCLVPRAKEPELRKYISVVTKNRRSSRISNVQIRWGIYEIVEPELPVEQMCDRALMAADSIKGQYERIFAIYDDSMRNRMLQEQRISSAMEEALSNQEFEVYLQPKFNLQDNCMAGAEALARWNHPLWGVVSPMEFIPIFERNGFIHKLDEYMREKVCTLLASWKAKGLPLLPISVNISRADVLQGELTTSILQLCHKYDISPSLLHLEITESAYTENTNMIKDTVATLRREGFTVEMDDFGSGYSSLNMLSQMPMDILKLDMTFLHNEIAKPVNRSFLSSIIYMAHQVDMSVVAEGVETRDQAALLRSFGCDYAQGYYFAKPMTAQAYETMLTTRDEPISPLSADSLPTVSPSTSLLVVDDDAAYRQIVVEEFSHKFSVMEAVNAQEALSILHSEQINRIAAIILSLSLPNNGTLTMFNALQEIRKTRELPVLATLPGPECSSLIPLAMEADDFLCKCHPPFDLGRRVERLVDTISFRQRETLLKTEATRDPLTGLLNRRGLHEALAVVRDQDMPLAVCLFDMDDLKKANDTCGHEAGDRVLQSFAQEVCRLTRMDDIKCRYGGDEFVVVLKNVLDEAYALRKGESICRLFSECAQVENLPAGCTVGVAFCKSREDLSPALIEKADKALYHAKRTHKGGSCLWKDSMENQ